MRHHGNGSSKTIIEFLDLPGYVHIFPQVMSNLPADISLVMNNALVDWLKRNPDARVRTVLPITQDRQTVMIHLWSDDADG